MTTPPRPKRTHTAHPNQQEFRNKRKTLQHFFSSFHLQKRKPEEPLLKTEPQQQLAEQLQSNATEPSSNSNCKATQSIDGARGRSGAPVAECGRTTSSIVRVSKQRVESSESSKILLFLSFQVIHQKVNKIPTLYLFSFLDPHPINWASSNMHIGEVQKIELRGYDIPYCLCIVALCKYMGSDFTET
jgi:hypothetical protein